MATLTVWKFATPEGADDAEATLEMLSKQELITIQDAATVTGPPGKKKPKTRQLDDLAGAGALGGAFWGLLFGLIFFVPLLGLAVGAAAGALGGSLADVGIDDDFINGVRAPDHPGHLGPVPDVERRRDRPGRGGVRGRRHGADQHQPVARRRGQAAGHLLALIPHPPRPIPPATGESAGAGPGA